LAFVARRSSSLPDRDELPSLVLLAGGARGVGLDWIDPTAAYLLPDDAGPLRAVPAGRVE
jgi:hypothetical protein